MHEGACCVLALSSVVLITVGGASHSFYRIYCKPDAVCIHEDASSEWLSHLLGWGGWQVLKEKGLGSDMHAFGFWFYRILFLVRVAKFQSSGPRLPHLCTGHN